MSFFRHQPVEIQHHPQPNWNWNPHIHNYMYKVLQRMTVNLLCFIVPTTHYTILGNIIRNEVILQSGQNSIYFTLSIKLYWKYKMHYALLFTSRLKLLNGWNYLYWPFYQKKLSSGHLLIIWPSKMCHQHPIARKYSVQQYHAKDLLCQWKSHHCPMCTCSTNMN